MAMDFNSKIYYRVLYAVLFSCVCTIFNSGLLHTWNRLWNNDQVPGTLTRNFVEISEGKAPPFTYQCEVIALKQEPPFSIINRLCLSEYSLSVHFPGVAAHVHTAKCRCPGGNASTAVVSLPSLYLPFQFVPPRILGIGIAPGRHTATLLL